MNSDTNKAGIDLIKNGLFSQFTHALQTRFLGQGSGVLIVIGPDEKECGKVRDEYISNPSNPMVGIVVLKVEPGIEDARIIKAQAGEQGIGDN